MIENVYIYRITRVSLQFCKNNYGPRRKIAEVKGKRRTIGMERRRGRVERKMKVGRDKYWQQRRW